MMKHTTACAVSDSTQVKRHFSAHLQVDMWRCLCKYDNMAVNDSNMRGRDPELQQVQSHHSPPMTRRIDQDRIR